MAAGQGTSAYSTSAYSKRDLMNLWTRAGGDPAKAGLAASVALAESSGRVTAKNVNTNGTVDRGLWQINSIHGDKSTFDPLANARAAVAISDNGASFHPWVTYNTGAYKKYTGSAGGTPAPQMMRGSAATSMTRTVPGEVTAGGVGVADLLQQLQSQHAMPAMSPPVPPQFSATSRYLKMGTVPASAGVVGASSKPSVADLLGAVQTTPLPVDKKITTKIPGVSGGSSGGSAGGTFAKGHSTLLELIHKSGSGGFAVKDGKVVSGPGVYGAVWDGHADHVHVAAGPKTIVDLGKLAQSMGLHVGENPHFGGVSPVHVKGSYHYKGEAIDVSGDPARMNAYARKVEQLYGIH